MTIALEDKSKLKSPFLELAHEVKKEMEDRGDEYSWGYKEIVRLINLFPHLPNKSELDVFGCKMYDDSDRSEDKALAEKLSVLSFMVRRYKWIDPRTLNSLRLKVSKNP